MTQEEAIEVVKKNWPDSSYTCLREALITLVPELNESEDEKIRKDIYTYIYNELHNIQQLTPRTNEIERWLSWLEKQKEKKPADLSEMMVHKEPYIAPVPTPMVADERKPISQEEWNDGKNILEDIIVFVSGYADKRVVTKWVSFLKSLRPQPKVEWSEEDTCILEDAVTAVDLLGNDDEYSKTHPNLAKAFRAAKDWLKCLPERFNLQPKQEWGEEDETALGDLMWCIKQASKSAKDENDMGNVWFAENWVKNRLKSIRPQPKQEWSEEDKEWLSKVYYAIDNSRYSDNEKRGMKKYIKSLRPQPKQEWSEEDKKLLDFWLDVIDRNDWRMDEDFCKASREFINRIKSFRPSWRPTKTMLDALNWAMSEFHPDCPTQWRISLTCTKSLNSCIMTGIEYMSNVCPTTSNGRDPNREDVADAFEDGIAEGVKRHWKPSEAQMSMLLAVINEPRNAGAESCHLALGDLYQDLKKLM